MPVILATWEVEIRRIAVQGQLGQIVLETPSQPMAGYGSMNPSSSQLHRGSTNTRIVVQAGVGIK
jgi:hypothetical protein